jgi:UDPglucose--hexose-1-phosphate uridylyltransferase
VRVVPNNNPYLRVETPLQKKGIGIFDMVSGTGANEVIIEMPEHNTDIDSMPEERVASIIKTYAARMNDLKNDIRLEYVLVFKNRGRRAGGHLDHAHSQLMALPVVPKRVQEEIDCAKEFFTFKNRCIYCDLVDNELMMKDRVVSETEFFLCITPFASRSPFEMWILPKAHKSHFSDIDPKEIEDFAFVLKDSIRRMNKALKNPAYNYIIHTSPQKSPKLEHYHWHIEISPRIKSLAGFEWGSGFYINPTIPEETAAFLRNL